MHLKTVVIDGLLPSLLSLLKHSGMSHLKNRAKITCIFEGRGVSNCDDLCVSEHGCSKSNRKIAEACCK